MLGYRFGVDARADDHGDTSFCRGRNVYIVKSAALLGNQAQFWALFDDRRPQLLIAEDNAIGVFDRIEPLHGIIAEMLFQLHLSLQKCTPLVKESAQKNQFFHFPASCLTAVRPHRAVRPMR